MDEFLELNEKYKTIQEFLKDKIFENCENIKINWLIYFNDLILYYENKPLQQRIKTFKHDNSFNKHIKSTVKGNLSVNYWEKLDNPHTSTLNVSSCSSSGKIIKYDSPYNSPPDYTNAKLKHYIYKSFEEWCIKIKRGKCDYPKEVSEKIMFERYKSLYYQNKNNSEKIKIIKRVFNKSNGI